MSTKEGFTLKKIAILLSIILILAAFAGCNGASSASADAKTMDVQNFADSVLEQVAFKDEHMAASERVLSAIYGVDFAKVKSYCVYISGTNSTAEEIAAFEVNDIADVDSIKAVLTQRITDQKNAYTNYNPVELKKIENAYIAAKGKYVVMIVADDTSSAEKLFNEALK